jgi:tetratricopeptide (TPR) repeat protein
VRVWFIERVVAGEHYHLIRRIAGGESIDDILPTLPVAPLVTEARALYVRALEIFERLGNRQGAMSTIIAMAYVAWGPEIHFPGSAKRIEELHRLTTHLKSFTKESERALAEAQMLFGAHIYARAKLFPDVALAKGKEAYAAARRLGDGSLEFAAAGGVALVYADLGDLEQAEQWLGRAAEVASAAPTPLRARKIEAWRGRIDALAGRPEGMREHLERAVQLAMDMGLPADRCEGLALLALEASRLGAERGDEELLALAERSALGTRKTSTSTSSCRPQRRSASGGATSKRQRRATVFAWVSR